MPHNLLVALTRYRLSQQRTRSIIELPNYAVYRAQHDRALQQGKSHYENRSNWAGGDGQGDIPTLARARLRWRGSGSGKATVGKDDAADRTYGPDLKRVRNETCSQSWPWGLHPSPVRIACAWGEAGPHPRSDAGCIAGSALCERLDEKQDRRD